MNTVSERIPAEFNVRACAAGAGFGVVCDHDPRIGSHAPSGRPGGALRCLSSSRGSALDLLGEHAQVERAGRDVGVDVLAVDFAALHEEVIAVAESSPSGERDRHGFRHHGTGERFPGSSAHG